MRSNNSPYTTKGKAMGKQCGILLVAIVLLYPFGAAYAAPITVSSTEVWAGATMHGINPSGSGTAGDPYAYVIPEGMILTSSGVIQMNDKFVTFDFSSGTGGLDMAAGSYFDLTASDRKMDDLGTCSIVLGSNNLTGAGDFKNTDILKDSMPVSITGLGDVDVNSLYLRTSDATAGSVEIDVAGSVSVASVDTQDMDWSGDDGGHVTITGSDLTVGSIYTRSNRGKDSGKFSGDVLLQASDWGGTNTLGNTINLYGAIDTNAVMGDDGDITISGVVVTLEPGFSATTPDGSLDIYAGIVQYGRTAEQLFIDNSGGGYTAIHSIPWTVAEADYYASDPEPNHYDEDVSPDVALGWMPGLMATFHDVYLGTEWADVNDANDPNVFPGRGRKDVNSYDPCGLLEFDTDYYWRIDEINEPNSWKGAVWTFTTADGKAYNPSPRDGYLSALEDANLAWTGGALALEHDVYFGTDFNNVNDANTTVTLGVYQDRQGPNTFEPGTLSLDTTYYWRIDEVGTGTFVRGDVWSFKTVSVRIIEHVIVYGGPNLFCGWPANTGAWTWGDNEIVVGFVYGAYLEQPGHNITSPSYTVVARSLDGGHTWTKETPSNFVGGSASPPPGGINFAHADFAMKVDDAQFRFSYDRGANWQGPYHFGDLTSDPNFDDLTDLDFTSRTDYIVNSSNECLFFMSAEKGASGTDVAYTADTADAGATFDFASWIVPPTDPYRAVMPSTVRCSSTKLVTALRRRDTKDDCWVDAYVSYDDGDSWSFLSEVGHAGDENGNPPALVRLQDGRLCCAYGNRAYRQIRARISEDEGATWGDEIILRDDFQADAYDDPDLGYPRMVQRPDGMLVTMYYWATPEHPTHHIAATIWDPELNTLPVADAGPDQSVDAGPGGIAEVQLDGSGSYDADGDELTYLWSWVVEDQNYTATGATPTIELPVGVHTVSLVVNDGTDGSSPDEVVITVTAPVQAAMRFTPQALNLHSRGRWVMAYAVLPEGFSPEDVNTSELPIATVNGVQIEADGMRVLAARNGSAVVLIVFDRREFCSRIAHLADTSPAQIVVTVVGSLTNGQHFIGEDTIKIMAKGRQNGPVLRRAHVSRAKKMR